jgi:hypothetical protein
MKNTYYFYDLLHDNPLFSEVPNQVILRYRIHLPLQRPHNNLHILRRLTAPISTEMPCIHLLKNQVK